MLAAAILAATARNALDNQLVRWYVTWLDSIVPYGDSLRRAPRMRSVGFLLTKRQYVHNGELHARTSSFIIV